MTGQGCRKRQVAGGGSVAGIAAFRGLHLTRFYEQKADRVHRRFLASVESLARVRKLITPLQINIAEQQVNVAGNVTTGKGVHDNGRQ